MNRARQIPVILFFFSAPLWLSGQQQGDVSETVNDNKSSFGTVFEGPPGRAALYSLVLPGAGQIYNGRWWKAPIVWAVEGTVAYFLIDRINEYNKWNTCYISLIESSPSAECGSVNQVSTAFGARQSARTNRELAWVFMGLTHLLNVVEAFVDRHLMNFDTTDDLSYHNLPAAHFQYTPEVPVWNVISLKIPLNGQQP